MEKESVPSRTRFSVLVVDRHEGVRSSLARRLRLVPTIEWVEEVATVEEARRVVGQAAAGPDIILLDPGGWQGDWRAQLAGLTSARPRGSVIALHVARTHNGYTNEARALGADCIVLKGLRTSELVALLADATGVTSE
jgi:DNA-binding NarL/FixJ family response regulator